MHVERIGLGATATEVLDLLEQRARTRGAPGPAALCGAWFGQRAIIAPSVQVQPGGWLPEVTPCSAAADGPLLGGGWLGYLGYEARRGDPAPSAWGWTDRLLRQDPSGCWWLEGLEGIPSAEAAELAEVVQNGHAVTGALAGSRLLAAPDRARHMAAVRRCQQAIKDGEVYQANVCTQYRLGSSTTPLRTFLRGVDALAPRRAAYLQGPWGALASFSPELFLSRHGAVVSSSPIKGTLPRRGEQDAGNDVLLRSSEKEVAENVMITDLMRNDLSRMCRPGTVTVPELLQVHPAPGVWHLVSTVSGTLRAGVRDPDLLAACFPAGSITGAPKLRAIALLEELERQPRGAYCGAIGLVSPLAGMELNVAIRTLEYSPVQQGGRSVRLGVGGGITAGSDPRLEWEEIGHKAAPLLELLPSGGQGPGAGRSERM